MLYSLIQAAYRKKHRHLENLYSLCAKLPNDRNCLLYTSDAADERSSVDLGGRRIIKKKKSGVIADSRCTKKKKQTSSR